jgi:hypothetical protein
LSLFLPPSVPTAIEKQETPDDENCCKFNTNGQER